MRLFSTTKPKHAWIDLDIGTASAGITQTVEAMRGLSAVQIARTRAALQHLSVAVFMGTPDDQSVKMATSILRGHRR